jgi:hypothetical protein
MMLWIVGDKNPPVDPVIKLKLRFVNGHASASSDAYAPPR